MAGISVRTLHVYDKLGLLRPMLRTPANYRLYGEIEMLRLQQILFYKELDYPLKEIASILDNPAFDIIQSLQTHKKILTEKRNRLNTLLNTIDRTIEHLTYKNMENFEELYEGMAREEATSYRKKAVEKWGEEAVTRSEKALLELPKLDLERLKTDQKDITQQLLGLMSESAESDVVQYQIARHYANIRSFWGVSDPTDLKAEQYKGLGNLYASDERYTAIDGKPAPAFAKFMRDAITYFADTKLK